MDPERNRVPNEIRYKYKDMKKIININMIAQRAIKILLIS